MKLNQNSKHLILKLYQQLLDTYGWRKWWHATNKFEIIIGAILVQNTNWNNAARGIANLKAQKVLNMKSIQALPLKKLKELIKPAGLYNSKATYIKAITDLLLNEGGFRRLAKMETSALRKKLLSVRGIGNETADVILAYIFKRPTFIADNYAQKFLMQHKIIKNKKTYKELQAIFHDALEADLNVYNEYHALIIHHGKFAKSKLHIS